MKVKAIISAALLMVCTMASAQTEKKYYMNVQTAPEEVQSYEVNSDLKVSWEQTQKGVTPSGYYSKDEVDKMLRRIDEELQANHYTLENHQIYLEDICHLLTGSRSALYDLEQLDYSFPDGVLTYLTNICLLLTGNPDLNRFNLYHEIYFPEGVLNNLIPHAKPETTPSMDLMEENKVLKNKLAELERRLEALEAKK
ncbi:MAG: hypothetical protein MJZ08_05195 [Bacteroidaceae bacterium]|nr:hypothetical protein [Bacteroidaceae bacterium]